MAELESEGMFPTIDFKMELIKHILDNIIKKNIIASSNSENNNFIENNP